jgi:hypothetical protein
MRLLPVPVQAPILHVPISPQQGWPEPPHSLQVRMAPSPVQVVPDFEQKAP